MIEIGEFYDKRIDEYGDDIRAVGWPSIEQQELRFMVLVNGCDLQASRILDIGCGLGDLATFISKSWPNYKEYFGVDVSQKMIEIAKTKNTDVRNSFKCTSYQYLDGLGGFDFIFMSGALNLRTEEPALSRLESLFSASRKFLNREGVISANFLSSDVDYKQDLHEHYNLGDVAYVAAKFWNDVRTLKGYGLYEFTVQAKEYKRSN